MLDEAGKTEISPCQGKPMLNMTADGKGRHMRARSADGNSPAMIKRHYCNLNVTMTTDRLA